MRKIFKVENGYTVDGKDIFPTLNDIPVLSLVDKNDNFMDIIDAHHENRLSFCYMYDNVFSCHIIPSRKKLQNKKSKYIKPVKEELTSEQQKEINYTLKTYNIDILPFRDRIFKDFTVDNYREMILALGFQIYRKKGYRFGVRFLEKYGNGFGWSTISEEFPYCNRFSRTEFKLGNPYVLEDHIFSHRIRKPSPCRVFNLSDEEKIKYRTALININEIKNRTFGALRDEKSNVLWIDLDNKKDDKLNPFQKLGDILNTFHLSAKDILFAEQNYFKGGLHVFIKLNAPINSVYIKKIEDYFREKGCSYEFNFSQKILRLPCSYEYLPIKIKDSDLIHGKIFDYKRFYKLTIDKFNKNTLHEVDITNIDKVINPWKYKITSEEEMLNDVKRQERLYWITPQNLFIRDNIIKKSIYKPQSCYKITSGERFELTKKIVPWGAACGLSIEEIANMIIDNNISSKDLPKMGYNGLLKSIKPFYDKCKKNVSRCNKSTNFVSNVSLLKDYQRQLEDNKDICVKLAEQMMLYINEKRKQHNNGTQRINKEKIEILSKQMPFFVNEIIGKILFDYMTHKRFSNNHYITPNGFQIPDSFISKLQDTINIQLDLVDNKLAKTSIQYLKYGLIKLFGFKEINNKMMNGKNGWKKGSCKFYELKSVYNIDSLIYRLFNIIVSNRYKVLPIEQIIYYILLEKKGELEWNFDESYLLNYLWKEFRPPDKEKWYK